MEQGWQEPEEQCRCAWQGFLLLQELPTWPGWDGGLDWQMLFLQRREGAQESAEEQRWPGQPNWQELEGGMYGFSAISRRLVNGVDGGDRYDVQLKLLRAVEARVSTSVSAVMESCSGRSGLIMDVVLSFLEER